jgi:hypothetical protein
MKACRTFASSVLSSTALVVKVTAWKGGTDHGLSGLARLAMRQNKTSFAPGKHRNEA